MIGDIFQPTHLLFLLVVVLLVLGPKRLPEMARSLGKGFRDFKEAISGEEHSPMTELQPHPIAPSPPPPAPTPAPPEPAAASEFEDAIQPEPATADQPQPGFVPGFMPGSAPEPQPEPVASQASTDPGEGSR